MRKRFYVGVKCCENAELNYEVFTSATTPTEASHGHCYDMAIGPFATKRGAEYLRDNRFVGDVATAERRAKTVNV